ncbi:MAG: tetratricopeptide repeat protein [Spirochaetaceae bacterium]|nr:MAG: tetratricopeptide repeat protein [Spirochaetaceae bacterium]
MKFRIFFSVMLFFQAFFLFAGNIDADRLLSEGLDLFQTSRYSEAVGKFNLIIQSPALVDYHSVAYFMLAKSYLGMNKLKEASDYLEYFLKNYKDHIYFSEAYYLKARLLFQQGDVENSIMLSEDFLNKYPGSPFVPNTYFLIGECLFAKGKFDEALKFYRTVMEKYPASAKVEAAQYRASLVGFRKREVELLKLLKWSYEDSLVSIEEYQRREQTYEQAIAAYQSKISGTGGTGTPQVNDLQLKLAEKEIELEKLKTQAAELATENARLKGEPVTDQTGTILPADISEELRKKMEMLEVKEKALEVKEQYLKWLETYLEGE